MVLRVTSTMDGVLGEMLCPVGHLFQGEHSPWTVCNNCGHESVSFDLFYSFQWELTTDELAWEFV